MFIEGRVYVRFWPEALVGPAWQHPDAGKIYDVEGTFRNLLLTLTYASADRSALDRGAFVLQLNGNGGSFCGHSSYYYNQDHSIIGAACEWRRITG